MKAYGVVWGWRRLKGMVVVTSRCAHHPASVLPTAVTSVRTPVLRTEPGIAIASYPSPGCDEPRRRELGGGTGTGDETGAGRHLTANLSLRHGRVRELIAQFVDGFLSKLEFEEFGVRRCPKPS